MAEPGFEPTESESRTPAFGYFLMHSKDSGGVATKGDCYRVFFIPVASEYPMTKG